MRRGSLLPAGAAPAVGERFEELFAHRNLVIEQIVSSDAPDPVEYVQAQDEWVVVLSGEAKVAIAGGVEELGAGDWLFLPAGAAHRVLSTAAGTVWLAVHLHPPAEA